MTILQINRRILKYREMKERALRKKRQTKVKNKTVQQMKPVETKRQAHEKVNQTEMTDRVPQNMVPRKMNLRKV